MITSPPNRIKAYRERGWWGDTRFDDVLRRNIASAPEREALVDPPNLAEVCGIAQRRITWREFGDLVDSLAFQMIEAGLTKDDIAIVQLPNCCELVAVYFACARLGVIASPVMPQYREHEIGSIVERTKACAFITIDRIGSFRHAEMAVAMMHAHPGIREVLVLGTPPAGARALLTGGEKGIDYSVMEQYQARNPISADDAITICWTSGSEGFPKGVARSHNRWLIYGSLISTSYEVHDGCRFLNGRPLVTHGAFVGTIVPWLHHAGTIVNHHPFHLETFLDQLRTERIGYTALAPAILSMLIARPELVMGVDFTRLRYIGSGSAPLTESIVKGLQDRFGVAVLNFYGATEGGGLVSAPHDVPDPAHRAMYFPRLGVPGFVWDHALAHMVETRIVDPESGDLINESGRSGEIRFRGPLIMDGYFNAPELDERAFDRDGYYCSGDLFEIAGEHQQFYKFVGRLKDIIIRGGFNISATDVENLVTSHPSVAEAAAVGFPDERLGERVCAVVVLRTGARLSLEELVAFMRNEMKVAVIKLPERLVVVDALPRNPNNKVLKAEVRKLAAAQTA